MPDSYFSKVGPDTDKWPIDFVTLSAMDDKMVQLQTYVYDFQKKSFERL